MLKADAEESERAFKTMKTFPTVTGLGDDGKLVLDVYHPPLTDNYEPIWHKGIRIGRREDKMVESAIVECVVHDIVKHRIEWSSLVDRISRSSSKCNDNIRVSLSPPLSQVRSFSRSCRHCVLTRQSMKRWRKRLKSLRSSRQALHPSLVIWNSAMRPR